MTIQFAAEEDTGLILRFIKELADYEGMLSEVEATEELLREWIFEKKRYILNLQLRYKRK